MSPELLETGLVWQAEVAQVRRAMQDKVEAAVAENQVKASGLSVRTSAAESSPSLAAMQGWLCCSGLWSCASCSLTIRLRMFLNLSGACSTMKKPQSIRTHKYGHSGLLASICTSPYAAQVARSRLSDPRA